MANNTPELSHITLHFSDGSCEDRDRGLFAHKTPAGGVEAICLGVNTTDYLTILAALEGVIDRVVSEAE